jgi:Zn-dependent protease with chaperone function
MSTASSLYPPGPEVVPEDLTRVSGAFRQRATFLIILIIVFFVLYAGLMFLAGYLLWLGITLPVHRRDVAGGVILKILLIPTGLLLLVFLCRGFFRRSRTRNRSLGVEIFAEHHPKLTAFLQRLCDDVGAPMPHRIFVDFEVNAAAGYGDGAFFSSNKNLYIGLGLVNSLNLTEFKAVLAHELAHISQRSLAVNSYGYVAIALAENMIIGRDPLDEWLERARMEENGLQVIVWPLWGISQGLRYLFLGLFYGLFLMLAALRRQMEFHADRVAVSVSGSDAIAHSLKRVTFGGMAMQRALEDLAYAAKRKQYTSDVFQQQDFAAQRLRKEAKDPSVFDPPPVSDDPRDFNTVFSPEDETDHPTMWADHPPDYQREDSAKEHYVRCPMDTRSPWLLFGNVEDLRLRVTHRMYRVIFRIRKDIALSDASDVRSHIEEEQYKAFEFDKRYHGVYDKRNINPGDLEALMRDAGATAAEPEQLIQVQAQLYDETTRSHGERYNKLLEEVVFLCKVMEQRESGENEGREFKFRGKYYPGKRARKLLREVEAEIEEENKFLAGLDRRVFLVHYRMALALGPALVRELKQRYAFHLQVQRIWSTLEAERRRLGPVLALLESGGNMSENDFFALRDTLNDAHAALYSCVEAAKDLNLPALKGLPAGEQLNRLLLEGKLVDGWVGMDYYIRGKWLRKFLKQFNEIQDNANRIHFKSLGTLLTLQESIGGQFHGSFAGAAK